MVEEYRGKEAKGRVRDSGVVPCPSCPHERMVPEVEYDILHRPRSEPDVDQNRHLVRGVVGPKVG